MSYLPIGPKTKAFSVPFTRATDEAVSEVAPVAKNSVTAWADVPGSAIDAQNFQSIAYTCVNTGAQTICWRVSGGNDSAFADAVIVQASADLTAAGVGDYSTTGAVWRYYKVEIQDKVGGTHGQATVRGIAKAS